jgi:hypothetical protein
LFILLFIANFLFFKALDAATNCHASAITSATSPQLQHRPQGRFQRQPHPKRPRHRQRSSTTNPNGHVGTGTKRPRQRNAKRLHGLHVRVCERTRVYTEDTGPSAGGLGTHDFSILVRLGLRVENASKTCSMGRRQWKGKGNWTKKKVRILTLHTLNLNRPRHTSPHHPYPHPPRTSHAGSFYPSQCQPMSSIPTATSNTHSDVNEGTNAGQKRLRRR